MRILYDYQVFSWQRYGGISRYYYELITRMTAVPGVDVALFMGLHINRYGLERYRDSCAFFWGTRWPAVPLTYTLFTGFNRVCFPGFLRRSRPDIYHPTYYARTERSFSGRRIITVFDMIHERCASGHPWSDRTVANKRRATSRADGVICISEATKRDVIEILKIPEDRLRVIYLGSSLAADGNAPPVVDAPYVLYVGERQGYKNFDCLARACARSEFVRRNLRLVCFGGGPFTKAERERAHSLGIGGIVRHVSGDDAVLANLYRHAAVHVCPSLHEGFGLPTLEAMQLGCPVLVADTSSLPEVAGPAGSYFDPTDSDDLSDKLEKVLHDQELRSRMVAIGLSRARMFSWDRCARETLDFYRDRGAHAEIHPSCDGGRS